MIGVTDSYIVWVNCYRVKYNKGQCSVAAELKIQVLLFLKATCFLWSIMSEVGMMLRLLRITCYKNYVSLSSNITS
jgi:hypothetical protein